MATTPGAEVEVRSRYEGRWVRGFEVEEVDEHDPAAPAVWVRRRSDGSRLPVSFAAADVRMVAAAAPLQGLGARSA